SRVDPLLFEWSYDYVGDLAETVALIWPEQPAGNRPPPLPEVIEKLQTAERAEVPALLTGWLDALDSTGRWALLKLITGARGGGVWARLAKSARGAGGEVDAAAIEEVGRGWAPPYEPLFAWLEGDASRPRVEECAVFRPLMLANPLEDAEIAGL